MDKGNKIFILAAVITVFVFSLAFAEVSKAAKYKHADKNKDGLVDKKEMHMEKKWEHKQEMKNVDKNHDGIIDQKEKSLVSWKHSRAKVNTLVEKKYDANGDGWIEANEAKEMLKDKHTLIQTHGKAKVDTAIEKEYDTNNDGVIDANEAKNLTEDIK